MGGGPTSGGSFDDWVYAVVLALAIVFSIGAIALMIGVVWSGFGFYGVLWLAAVCLSFACLVIVVRDRLL
jgi:hypothetical protein